MSNHETPVRTDDTKRLHFVSGDLADELDRLGIARAMRCVSCGESTSDDEVGYLKQNEPVYDTVCIDCKEAGV